MKHIIITGCSSGLGRAMAEEALTKGHKIFPHYRRDMGGVGLVGDVTDWNFADNFSEYLKISNADVFINNAAIYSAKPIEEYGDKEIERIFEVNVLSQINLIKRAYTYFKKKKSGLIININSLATIHPGKNETIYCASKWAIKGFSKSLQIEAIGTGVEIIDVHPGGIQTRMTKDRDNFDSLMNVSDVATQVIDLVQRKSNYVNEIVLRKRNESK